MIENPQFDRPSNFNGASDSWDNGLAGQILTAEYFEETITGRIKVFLSGVFQSKPVKVFLSGAWVTKPLKWWNGSSWVATNY